MRDLRDFVAYGMVPLIIGLMHIAFRTQPTALGLIVGGAAVVVIGLIANLLENRNG